MESPRAGLWPRVPGYDSEDGSEDGDSEADNDSATLEERLQQVLGCLGDRWVERPLIRFEPAPMPGPGEKPRRGQLASAGGGVNSTGPCFRMEHANAVLVHQTFLTAGLSYTHDQNWLVQWSGPGMRESIYQGLHEFQRVNHFPGSTELTRKDRLWLHFNDMALAYGSEVFDFCPETYVLPDQVEQFLERYERSKCLWIVKPHASSRGRGIFLLRDLSELPLEELSVVSRYVDNPLLIQGLKFDLRVYVLVTSYEPLRAYVYREGLVRFASKPYSTAGEHLQDAYRHLTNYSINKSAPNFMENRTLEADNMGHKWSISALNRHLRCVGIDVDLMWCRIMDLIMKTLFSVEPSIAAKTRQMTQNRPNCFELYGFDVMVDEDLKAWLLEVNLSPSMEAESPLDWQVKSSALSDLFNLVGIYNVDRATCNASKLRCNAAQVRRNSSGRNGLTSASQPPPSAPTATSTAGKVGLASTWHGSFHAPPAESQEPVMLDNLSEGQLKMLARAMQERSRCQNFIRLFPTRSAVRRYAPIVAARGSRSRGALSASQLLAAALYGPKPLRAPGSANAGAQVTRSRSFHLNRTTSAGFFSGTGGAEGRATGAGGSRSTAATGSASSDEPDPEGCWQRQSGNQVSAAERQAAVLQLEQALVRLDPKERERVVLMEYLLRMISACEALGAPERAKLAQSAAFGRFLSFRRRLAAATGADGKAASGATGGGLIDELLDDCRAGLASLERDAGDSDDEDIDQGGLASRLPDSLRKSAGGRQAAAALPKLAATDLERVLQGPQCSPGLAALVEAPAPGGDSPSTRPSREGGFLAQRPSSSRSRQSDRDRRRTAGPLTELLRAWRPPTLPTHGGQGYAPRAAPRGRHPDPAKLGKGGRMATPPKEPPPTAATSRAAEQPPEDGSSASPTERLASAMRARSANLHATGQAGNRVEPPPRPLAQARSASLLPELHAEARRTPLGGAKAKLHPALWYPAHLLREIEL